MTVCEYFRVGNIKEIRTSRPVTWLASLLRMSVSLWQYIARYEPVVSGQVSNLQTKLGGYSWLIDLWGKAVNAVDY